MDRNASSFFFREMVYAGAYIGKGERSYSVLHGQPERVPVGGGQQLFFAFMTAVPHRPYGMDDIFGGQVTTGGDHGFADSAAALFGADRTASLQDHRTAGTMDGAIHTATAEQRGIGSIDDGVDGLFRDVALDDLDAGCCTHTISNLSIWRT